MNTLAASFAATPSPTAAGPLPEARCPYHGGGGTRPAGHSVFVEKAAAEVRGSERFAGDPAADALLAAARKRIYHWPEDFFGFRATLVVREGPDEWRGPFEAVSSRNHRFELGASCGAGGGAFGEGKWLRFQIEELLAHREPPRVSGMASKAGVIFGDEDATYGRQVIFQGDKMGSFYRLKDECITQIGRGYGGLRFVINIDQHQNCGAQFAASAYTAAYRDAASGTLSRTEIYLDRYEPLSGIYLPAERRYTEANATRTFTRQITFENLALLSWDTDLARDAALF